MAEVLEPSANDSDEEAVFAPKKTVNNYRNLLDSDSEDEKVDSPEKSSDHNRSHLKSSSEDSEDEENADRSRRNVLSSDSEQDVSMEAPKKDRRKNSNPKKKIPAAKTQRKSAAKAMETIKDKISSKQQQEEQQKILSEKQRMEREREIRVPYHKPKQYSLKEFMARRTINKPSTGKIQMGQSSILTLKKLNNSEELEKFAQKMKEREEEALEFFRSESESEDEEDKENVASNVEKAPEDEKMDEFKEIDGNEVDAQKSEEAEKVEDSRDVRNNSSDLMDLAVGELPDDLMEVDVLESSAPKIVESLEAVPEEKEKSEDLEAPTSSVKLDKVQVSEELENQDLSEDKSSTEVTSDDPPPSAVKIESDMDRLREKYKNFVPVDDENPKQKTFSLKTLNEMGSKDFVIDLETGGIVPKKLTGPEMLFQRYLKTVQKPKPKESICMNILSIENGTLENEKVKVKLEKEMELDHNRPGFSHEMFKETLKSQIVKRRMEDIQKRLVKEEQKVELEPEDKPEVQEDGEDDENEEEVDDEEEDDIEDEEDEEELEEKESKKKHKKPSGAGAFVDDEAIDEDESENEDEDDDEDESSSSSEDEVDAETTAPKKGRILKAFEDSDDEAEKDKNDLEPVAPAPETEKVPLESQILDSEQISSQLMEKEVETQENVSEPLFTSEDLLKKIRFSESDNLESLAPESQKNPLDDLFTQTQPSTLKEPSASENFRTSGIEDLVDVGMSQAVEDDDLLEICSGRFAPTQAGNTQATSALDGDFISQVEDSENIESTSPKKVEDSQVAPQMPQEEKTNSSPAKPSRNVLESTDDELDNATEKKKRKKLKKKKQKVKKLGFSDDEEDEEIKASEDQPDDEEIEYEECEEEQEEDEEPEVLVDYDSEENEVEVKMTKKDRIKAAENYFENEAELSESEWGSADEDEKDLDKFDMEMGDEDEFDQTKLREEVGRIHARKVLDDDIRDVKKIQELLFEDEEKDGVGRNRKFRWKNQTEGFTLEDENARDGDALEEDDGEYESEMMWRKMRHEREMILSEQSQKMTESETMSEEILLLDQNSQTVTSSSTSMLARRKFKIIKSSSLMGNSLDTTPPIVPKKDSPFLIKAPGMKKFQSSSFLSRDEKTLSKIAQFMSHKDDDVTMSSTGNSMSFVTIDKPDESKKRKSNENQQPESKKRKLESKKSFLLDQLK